jgi:hypothetical protein
MNLYPWQQNDWQQLQNYLQRLKVVAKNLR